MIFSSPLVSGRLIRRYKRFLADIALDQGEEVTASVPNTGSMLGLAEPGMRVWLSHSDAPTRKYRYRLELVETRNTLVGINTSLPNQIAQVAISAGIVPTLRGYESILREQRYDHNSRIDLLLRTNTDRHIYVEVKNVHFVRTPGLAEFPDTVTARGAKHLAALRNVVEAGHRGVMLFVIQRHDCHSFAVCHDLDPFYGQQFALARQSGVEAYAIRCKIGVHGIFADTHIPIVDN